MKTVTYRGPEDLRDRTSRYRIGDRTFPKGTPIYSVPNELADELAATEGQKFEIKEGGEREISPPARKLADEEKVDLDSIGGDGPIGIDDVRAVIAEREEQSA